MPIRHRLLSARFMAAIAAESFLSACAFVAIAATCAFMAAVDLLSVPITAGAAFLRSSFSFARRLVSDAFLALLILCVLATNQASAAVVNSVDLQPFLASIIDLAIYAIGPPLALLAVGLLKRLYDYAGVKRTAENEAKTRHTVDQALGWAAEFARAKFAAGVHHEIPLNLRNEAIAHGVEYALEAIPETLKKLGVADKASKRLSAMVEARLGPSAVAAEALLSA